MLPRPGDDPLVEQQQLDRRGAAGEPPLAARAAIEVRAAPGPSAANGGQSSSSSVAHQVERAEAARVVEREPPALVGLDQQMIVLADLGRVDPPAARHAEMEDQRVAAVGVDQPIFRAAAKPGDPRAGQPLAEVDREAPGAGPARRASTRAMRRPFRTRSRPRTVVSTSGSSGIAARYGGARAKPR